MQKRILCEQPTVTIERVLFTWLLCEQYYVKIIIVLTSNVKKIIQKHYKMQKV